MAQALIVSEILTFIQTHVALDDSLAVAVAA